MTSVRQWQGKFNFPYDLVKTKNVLGDKTLPPWVHISTNYNPKRFTFTPSAPFGLDLTQAVKRQISFARRITALYPYGPVPDALLLDSQQRYAKFMNLIRLNATRNPVPAMDIDLFWHTHQLSSSNYLPWCTHHIGRPINHDDTIAEAEISTGLDEIIVAWGDSYFEDYLNPPRPDLTFQSVQNPPSVIQQEPAPRVTPENPPPGRGNPPPGSFPGPTTAHKIPPPGLTPAQLKLWHFDVSCQADHEKCVLLVLKAEREVAAIEKELMIINPPRPPPTAADLERGILRGVLRAVAKAAVSGGIGNASRLRQLNDKRRSTIIAKNATISSEETRRQDRGRERWPLLCAARGWGDPRVTHGKFKRPPQGTTELPFPVYAATWYEDKGLMYYNCFTGRGFEGGGMRVGGGMCGANFDGGNCTAKIIYESTTSGMCSGGG